MMETSGRVLRSDDVEVEGQYRLGLAAGDFEASAQGHSNAVMAPPQARIVENGPTYAVVEVICSCGSKVCLKCEYSAADVSGDS